VPAFGAQVAELRVRPGVWHGREDPHLLPPTLQQHLVHRFHREEVAFEREGAVAELGKIQLGQPGGRLEPPTGGLGLRQDVNDRRARLDERPEVQ
jgi:hypothetical protein